MSIVQRPFFLVIFFLVVTQTIDLKYSKENSHVIKTNTERTRHRNRKAKVDLKAAFENIENELASKRKKAEQKARKLGSDDFPPLPPADQIPIIINSPPVNVPKPKSPYESAGRLVFVPTIIYPKHKKRVIVHHGFSMEDYYRKMFYQSAFPYFKAADKNKFWKPIVKENDFFQGLKSNSEFKKGMSKIKWPFTAPSLSLTKKRKLII